MVLGLSNSFLEHVVRKRPCKGDQILARRYACLWCVKGYDAFGGVSGKNRLMVVSSRVSRFFREARVGARKGALVTES